MRTLIWDNSFKRAFKRFVRKNPQLQEKIFSTLSILEKDPFASSLKSHKLSGQLEGLYACFVAYNCRIIFALREEDKAIVLIDIGTHDEVY